MKSHQTVQCDVLTHCAHLYMLYEWVFCSHVPLVQTMQSGPIELSISPALLIHEVVSLGSSSLITSCTNAPMVLHRDSTSSDVCNAPAPILRMCCLVLLSSFLTGLCWVSDVHHSFCILRRFVLSISSSSASPSMHVQSEDVFIVTHSVFGTLLQQPVCLPDLNVDLRGLRCEDLLLSCKIRAAFCLRATRRHPDPHVENEHASVLPQRHDLSCPQVDGAWLVLREDYVMTHVVDSVHSDQCSRRWFDFEHNSLNGAQISPPVDGHFAFLLDPLSTFLRVVILASLPLSSAAFFSCSSR